MLIGQKMDVRRQSILMMFLAYFSLAQTEYEMWSPEWMPKRDDLLCKKSCQYDNSGDGLEEKIKTRDDCCTCKSKPVWEYNVTLINLDIEFVSTLGNSLLISQSRFNNQNLYGLNFKDKSLSFFPSNLCQWDSNKRLRKLYNQQFTDIIQFYRLIVKMDLSENKITELIDLNCLGRLDTLDLSNNMITSLSNTSLSNLTHLRELYLQNNKIQQVDASAIAVPQLSLQRIDISNNLIEKMDVTNFFSLHPFCDLNYDNNNINEFVNVLGFKLSTEKTYGPGMVHMKNNNMETFPNFKELLHLDSLSTLGSLFNFGFDLRGIPLICDCNLAPFMNLAKEVIDNLWMDYFNVTCEGPEELKGQSIAVFINEVHLDELICNLTETPECGPCSCIDQPSKGTLFVNCSGKGLTQLPDFLPSSDFSGSISLDLSNNQITTVKNTSYLGIVSHISLANNTLVQIDSAAAQMLENTSVIDLSNNPSLSELPPVLQYKNNSNIILHNLTIDCNCDNSWIQNWKGLKEGNQSNTFQCRVPDHGVMPPDQFSEDLLDCDQASNILITLSILLSFIVFILIIAGLVSYWFRYEILILMIRTRQMSKYTVSPILDYDAYISFDDDNDDLRQWTNMTLVSYLEQSGYKLFIPLRDLKIGDVRDLNTIEILNKTKNFLLILSESYLSKNENSWMDHEWKYGWHMYKTDKTKNIVMINFDQCLTSDTDNSQMKAFLRVGGVVDFSNLDGNILKQISDKLGPPNSKVSLPKKPQDSKDLTQPWELFQVVNNRNIPEPKAIQNLSMLSLNAIDKNHNKRFQMPCNTLPPLNHTGNTSVKNTEFTTGHIKSENRKTEISTSHIESENRITENSTCHIESENRITENSTCHIESENRNNVNSTCHIESENRNNVNSTCHIESENRITENSTCHIESENRNNVNSTSHIESEYRNNENIRLDNEDSNKHRNEKGYNLTSIDLLATEKVRPAYGRYKYYV